MKRTLSALILCVLLCVSQLAQANEWVYGDYYLQREPRISLWVTSFPETGPIVGVYWLGTLAGFAPLNLFDLFGGGPPFVEGDLYLLDFDYGGYYYFCPLKIGFKFKDPFNMMGLSRELKLLDPTTKEVFWASKMIPY